MTFANKRFAIVGAGLMGRLLSLSLAKRGAKVELFDKGGIASEFIGQDARSGFGIGNLNEPADLSIMVGWNKLLGEF